LATVKSGLLINFYLFNQKSRLAWPIYLWECKHFRTKKDSNYGLFTLGQLPITQGRTPILSAERVLYFEHMRRVQTDPDWIANLL